MGMTIKKYLYLSVAICVMLTMLVSAANAGTVVDDNFNRTGSLTGTLPSPGPGGVWTKHSGTEFQMQTNGAEAIVIMTGAESEDTHTTFSPKSTGSVTANFDIEVSAAAAVSGTDNEYFAHFWQSGDFTYPARLHIIPPTGAGDYTLGLASSSGGSETSFPTDFSFGSTVNVDLSWDFASGLPSLTVGANTITTGTAILGEAIGGFALRQSGSSSDETILVDNLHITCIPEPSTLVLMVMGMVSLVAVRRRKA